MLFNEGLSGSSCSHPTDGELHGDLTCPQFVVLLALLPLADNFARGRVVRLYVPGEAE